MQGVGLVPINALRQSDAPKGKGSTFGMNRGKANGRQGLRVKWSDDEV